MKHDRMRYFSWNCTFAVTTTHANMDTWWSSDSSFSYNVSIKPFLGNDYRVFACSLKFIIIDLRDVNQFIKIHYN